ncbi:MAG: GGDEF domain-containing protein [Rhodospirillaceae bacterium]|nr:GGDEF domain-containing protein [Rhodospirillaceae bacterium]
MALDIRTLFVVLTVMMMVSALALWFTWWLNRTVNGVLFLAYGQSILSIGIMLIMLRQKIDPILSIAIADGLLALGYMLLYKGAREFQLRSSVPKIVIGGITIFALLFCIYFQFIMESNSARMIFMFSLLTILSIAIAKEYLQSDTSRTPATIVVGLLWLFHSLVNFTQVLGLIWSPINVLMDPANYTEIMMIESIVLSVSFALGVTIMTTNRLQEELRYKAMIDPLTEIFNRRAFFSAAEPAVSRAERFGTPISVLVMDLDNFKNVNDTFGHATGDKVLCHFVDLAQASLRGADILGRFGGEEFIALLPDTDAEQAVQIADRLRKSMSKSVVKHNDESIHTTVSIGVTVCVKHPTSLEDMVKSADEALYEAKNLGRNRVAFIEIAR